MLSLAAERTVGETQMTVVGQYVRVHAICSPNLEIDHDRRLNSSTALNPKTLPFVPVPHIVPHIVVTITNCSQDEVMHELPADSTSTAAMITAIMKHINKSSTEIKKFTGDHLEYEHFIRQFHTKIVNNIDEYDERIKYNKGWLELFEQ